MKYLTGLWQLLGACLFVAVTASNASAAELPAVQPVVSCEQLGAMAFSNAVGEKVTLHSATLTKTEKGNFCQISATIAPSIGVEIALPAEQWTQRFLQVGCGGLCGSINLSLSNANGCVPAMNGEFAVAATDMGHQGSMMDATWAEDPQKRIDFAYRANHLTAVLSKALIAAYYGQPQRYAYFMGCSDGGREALMEAQRYPEDFNGISAGAPAAFFQFQNSFFHGWNSVANQRKDGTAILLQDRLAILHKAVLKHCPTLSGVNDGLLQNPYACSFSANWVKRCAEKQSDKSDCLTQEEIDVARKLYAGAGDVSGNRFVLGGLPLGSEMRWPAPAKATERSLSESMVLPALQSVLLPGGKQPITKMSDFPLNRRNFDAVAQLAPLYNAANTNLRPFMQHGGKLIMWHGLADDSVSPAFSLAYYRGVNTTLGKASVDKFMRLFLLPGVGHCGNGEGYDQMDLLTPLMAWTEEGDAPKWIVTGKAANPKSQMPPAAASAKGASSAEVQFHGVQKKSSPIAPPAVELKATRPVYPYPYIARYTGQGDPNDASHYRPVLSEPFFRVAFVNPARTYIGPDNQKTYEVKEGKLVEK